MTTSLSLPRLALGRATLRQLTAVLEREIPAQAGALLREVGFAAGLAAYEGFVESVSARFGVETPQALDARYLGEAVGGFFREEGWGTLGAEALAPGILALDSPDWVEAEPRGAAVPSCHFSTGMWSDFFTRVGGYQAAVMEVECRSRGDARCRFLVASPDLLTWLYEGMMAGERYERLIERLRAA
jgi:predicted hydrocarbon binding protein